MFFVNHSANGMLSVDGEDGELSEEETRERKPVWVDEEEKAKQILLKLRKLRKEEEESLISGSVYMSRLRAQHAELNPGTEWAQLDRELRDGSYSDDDVLGACILKAVDECCINGTSLCTSPTRTLFAGGGSDCGIVNIYSGEEFLGGKRKPIKTIENLTTKVDFLKFNGDGQILVPSFTVFSNWPPLRRSIHYPRCLDFSPGGCFMAGFHSRWRFHGCGKCCWKNGVVQVASLLIQGMVRRSVYGHHDLDSSVSEDSLARSATI